MCGIAGYFAPLGLAEAEGRALLERMAAALAHRGPDGRGLFAERHAGLASTRLAIVDPLGGHMPMSDRGGQLSVVHNGEIYNHQAVRRRLEGQGHHFSTRADTEVLLPLYREEGVELMASLTGMFAFALWDRAQQRLLLARDRFGMKPLFFAEARGVVLFGSELKAILASGLVDRKIDPLALRDLGSCGYPMPPRTMIAAIRALPPGHRWLLEAGRATRSERWYAPPYAGGGAASLLPTPRFRAAGASFAELMKGVVSDHLLADVEVGSYLSGGIDSVSVAALAKESLPGLHTFAMTFPQSEAGFDESAFSNAAAAAIGSRHEQVEQAPFDYPDYAGTIRALEAPQVHTVGFCLFRLSRAVRDAGLKVVLSGEGADEVLGGYSVFKLSQLRRSWLGGLPPLRRTVGSLLLRREPALAASLARWWALEPRVMARYGLVPPWVEQWWILAEAFRRILTSEVAALLPADPLEWLPDPPGSSLAGSVRQPLHRDLAFEQASRLDGWVLPLGDRLSMAHSVELRVPFLDHRVVEFTAGVPSAYLLRRSREKRLLREAMRRQLPEGLRRRKKRAFVAPVRSWLFGEQAPAFVDDLLSPASLERSGHFSSAAILAQRQAAREGGRSMATLEASWTLNLALGLEVFCRELGAEL